MDIFESVVPQSGEFFKFKNVGDAIQGTYIGKSEGVDSFNNEQIIYLIQDKDGKVWNVAFRKESLFVNERMAGIKLGQIVGYRFDEERDSKKMPGKKAKIIRIYADNKFVDKEWIERQKLLEDGMNNDPVSNYGAKVTEDTVDKAIVDAFELPTDATAVSGSMPTTTEKPKNDALEAIRTLAKTKGLTHESMAEEDADRMIEEFAGLKLEDANLTKIIIALTGYTK